MQHSTQLVRSVVISIYGIGSRIRPVKQSNALLVNAFGGSVYEVTRGKRKSVAFTLDSSINCAVLDNGKKLHLTWNSLTTPQFDPMIICILYPFNPMTVRGILRFDSIDDVYVAKKRKTAQV
jgi:hypothetical protein